MNKPKPTLVERLDRLVANERNDFREIDKRDYKVLRKALAALDQYNPQWDEIVATDGWENEGGSVNDYRDLSDGFR